MLSRRDNLHGLARGASDTLRWKFVETIAASPKGGGYTANSLSSKQKSNSRPPSAVRKLVKEASGVGPARSTF